MTLVTDYAGLIAARDTLLAMEEMLTDAAHDATGPEDAAALARVSALSSVAESAIFDVLNAAHVYLEDGAAMDAMWAEGQS